MEERDHLPPAPLGYYWRVFIDLHGKFRYASVSLHPNVWAKLNPGKSMGHGTAVRDAESRADVYRRLVEIAWIGHDMEEATRGDR